MSDLVTWLEKELGIIKGDIIAIEPSIIAWAHNFLKDVTPVLIKAANDAVLAAVTIPGGGAIKFAAAVATATADLIAQGVPVVDKDLKAAVQIAYKALPDDVKATSAAQAVTDAANAAVDKGAAAITGAA